MIFQPETMKDALSLLAYYGNQLVVVGGGTDVLPALRAGKYGTSSFMDISRLDELSFCYKENDWLFLGPSLTHTQILEHELVRSLVPLLGSACSSIGSPQIRNRGTLGGNIITHAACSDSLPALLVLHARLTFTSSHGSRTVPLSEYLSSPICESSELLTCIAIPLSFGTGWTYYHKKIARRQAAAKSRISIAMMARMEAGRFSSCSIVCGAVTPVPWFIASASDCVLGEIPSEELGRQAGALAIKEISENVPMRHSYAYKLPVLQELVKRAIVSCGRLQ